LFSVFFFPPQYLISSAARASPGKRRLGLPKLMSYYFSLVLNVSI
jgi:hypothetical protein